MSDVVDILHAEKGQRFLQVDSTFLMIFLGPYRYLWQSIIWLMHSRKVFCRSASLLAAFLKTYTIDFSFFCVCVAKNMQSSKPIEAQFFEKKYTWAKRNQFISNFK